MAAVTLSPFVGGLADAVRDALLAVLGVATAEVDAFALRALDGAAPGWVAELALRRPAGLVVEVFDAAHPRDAWFRTAHFACAYRATAAHDPFARPDVAAWLAALRARVARVDRRADLPPP